MDFNLKIKNKINQWNNIYNSNCYLHNKYHLNINTNN